MGTFQACGAGLASGKNAERKGLTLLHSCRAAVVVSGEMVTFDSYILNEGTELLSDVRLVPVSFSNAAMAQLCYISAPAAGGPFDGVLLPGSFVKFTAQYRVEHADTVAGGPLISAMAATGVGAGGLLVRDEADVVLEAVSDWDEV